jgi:uncharacterized protein YjiS (DUF1127 family)
MIFWGHIMESTLDHLDLIADIEAPVQIEPLTPKLARGLAYAKSQRRREQEIARLDRLSDRDLKGLGLTRDQIVLHVYRYLMD